MSKVYYTIIIVFLVSFFSCTKTNKQEAHYQATQDSIKKYLDIAKNDSLPFEKRDLYNSKAFGLIAKGDNNRNNRDKLDEVLLNYFNLNDWEKYDFACKLLLKNSLKANDSLHIANSFRYKGNFFYNKSCLDSSYYLYNKAEKIYKKIGDENGLSVIHLKKGVIQYKVYDYCSAEVSLKKAYKKLNQNRDYDRVYTALSFLGSVSTELNEFDNAIKYFEQASKVLDLSKLNQVEEKARLLNDFGYVFFKMENYNKALYYYELAREKANEAKFNPILYSDIINNLANCKIQINDLLTLRKNRIKFHSFNI